VAEGDAERFARQIHDAVIVLSGGKTDPEPMRWDDSVRADFADLGAWKDEPADDLADHRLTLDRKCPRCLHSGTRSVVYANTLVVRSLGGFAADKVDETGQADTKGPTSSEEPPEEAVFCECDEDHPGHPKDEPQGCGAWGYTSVYVSRRKK